MTYERQFFQYLDNLKRRIYAQPMNLGGVASSGGGVGGPPGGFLGYLPQTRITYDKLESATHKTVSSGPSLWDNLNHIRKRIETVEASGVFYNGFSIEKDDIEIADEVIIINFEGSGVSVLDEGAGKVTITISGGIASDTDAIHDNEANEISAIAEKSTPVDADILIIEDSAASYVKKKVQVSNLPVGAVTFLDLTDVDPSSYSGEAGKVVVVNPGEDGLIFDTVSGAGASTFLGLTDTPSAFTGKAGYSAVVNQAQNALEFVNISGGAATGFYYIQEDLSPQIPAGSDNYNLQYTPASGTLILHYNGLTQQYSNFTVLTSGVHTSWSPSSGDELLAEYYYGNPTGGVINPTITIKSGSTTINNVTTLNIEGMEVTDDGGGQVTILGGTGSGSGTPAGSFWSADAAPASPSAYDDEFDDESFDSGLWTDFDEPTGLTYVENAYGLNWTAHSTSNYIQGIYQNVPAYQGWSIMCKVSVIYKQHDDNKCGLMLLEDVNNLSTSDICIYSFTSGGAGTGVQVEKFNAYNSYLGNIGSMSSDKWITTMYLRIRAASDNWYFDWSNDGIGWYEKDDWYPTGSGQTKLWEPEGFGLFVRGNNTNCQFFVHWFRYSTNTGYNIVEGNRINYYEA